jgi:hypothetical protein
MYLGMNKSGFVHTLPGGMLRLTLGRIFQVQVATLFALVQMKSGRERSMPCVASEEWRDK